MIIQFNTDRNIDGNQRVETFVRERLESKLDRFATSITRIEVHLSDQNADKGGNDDVQCRLEARMQNYNPVVVTAREADKHKAIEAAVEKLKSALDTIIGRLRKH